MRLIGLLVFSFVSLLLVPSIARPSKRVDLDKLENEWDQDEDEIEEGGACVRACVRVSAFVRLCVWVYEFVLICVCACTPVGMCACVRVCL